MQSRRSTVLVPTGASARAICFEPWFDAEVQARIPALEAARGAAALMVVATHVHSFHVGQHVPQEHWLGFTARGFLGVQVFFVLSGLVLYLPYARGKTLDVRSYATARLARIVPALWVAMAGAWLLTGIWSVRATRHALFLNAWGDPTLSPDPPAWSLTVEMGFYILLPVLVIVFVGRPVYRAPMLIGLIVLGLVMRQGLWEGWPRTPLSYVDNFAIGMLAAMVVARVSLPRWTLAVGAAAFVAAVAAPGMYQMRAIPLALAALLFAVALTTLGSVNPPTPRTFVWLGTVSYGIYLWHWPILDVTTRHGLYRLPDPLEIVVVAALATLAGWASWRLVERPVLSRVRRHGEHSHKTVVAAPGREPALQAIE